MRVGQIIRIDSPRAQVVGQPEIQERVEPIAGRYLNRLGTNPEQLVRARRLMQRRHPGFLTLLWVHRRTMTNYECCIQYINPQRNVRPSRWDGWVGAVEATMPPRVPPLPPGTVRKTMQFSLEQVMDFIGYFYPDEESIDTNNPEELMWALTPFIRQHDSDFILPQRCETDPSTLVVTVTYIARNPTIPEGGVITPSLTLSSGTAGFPGSGNLIVTSEGVRHDLGPVQDFQVQHNAEQQALNSVITKPKESKTNRIKLEDENGSPRPNREHLLPDD